MMDYKMLINEIQAHNKDLIEQVKEKNAELQRLREENERYKETLEFYADPQIWEKGKLITDNRYEMPLAYNDNGEKAQQELKGES